MGRHGNNTQAQEFLKACRRGQLDLVRAFLDAGVDIDVGMANKGPRLWIFQSESSLDASDPSPLYFAVDGGHVAVARLLLESGADPNRCNTTHGPTTPLCVAISRNSCAMVELLLEFGADVDTRGEFGRTPLTSACRAFIASAGLITPCKPELVEILLDHGASMLKGDPRTPLYHAVDGRKLRITRLLLERGAPVDLGCTDPTQFTPLYNSVRRTPDLDVTRLLLAHGASFDRVCREPDGSLLTPLSLVRKRLQETVGTQHWISERVLNELFDSYLQHYWKLRVRLRVFGPISEHLLDLHVALFLIGDGILNQRSSG